MRKSAGPSDPESVLSLESFIDIVFNVLGVLFFVVAYAALSAFGMVGKVVTPMLTEGKTKEAMFVCRSNTVFDIDGLVSRVMEIVEQAAPGRTITSFSQLTEIQQKLEAAKIEDDHYRLEFMMMPPTISLVPKEGARGESAVDLLDARCSFLRELGRLDPVQRHIFFLVGTDSFEIFHTARRIAREKGFNIGWEPINAAEPIRFGSGGVVDASAHF